jgi:hypothetical protein
MTGRPGRLAALAVLAGLSPPARAQPSEHPPLYVRAPPSDCGAPPASPGFVAFVDSLRVELASSGPGCCTIVAPDAPIPPPGVTLALEGCDPGADDLGVEVADLARGTTRSRRISLADVAPAARPRALALAVAELVRSIEQAPAPAAPPSAPPEGRPAQAALPFVPRAAALAELRVYGNQTRLWGGGLALAVDRGRWRAGLDLDAASGRREVGLGAIDVTLASARMAVGPRLLAGPSALDLGLVGELGWGHIDGQPGQAGVSAGSGSGLTIAVGARAAIEAPAGRSVRARLAVEAGAVARSLTGTENGAPAAGVSGAYLLVAAGIGTGL